MYGLQALASDECFVRISKGIYSLRALAPPESAPVPVFKTKGQRTPRPPRPRFDPSAALEPPVTFEDAFAGDDTVPVDFLDGNTVLQPLPANADPHEAMEVEEEYIEEEDFDSINKARLPALHHYPHLRAILRSRCITCEGE